MSTSGSEQNAKRHAEVRDVVDLFNASEQDKEQNKLVCVVNDYNTFNKVVKNNENLAGFDITDYDNTKENIAITKRYNRFIEETAVKSDDNFWVLFVHQDFGIEDNITSIVEKLDKNCIFGAVGATLYRGLFFGKIDGKWGFKKSVSLTWGEIQQGQQANNDFKKYGRKISGQKTVDTVDCCCVMIHSSLIKKYKLRFDEKLSFHMYAEELCYSAKKQHEIKTKVVQIKCYHLGKGKLNEGFYDSVKYLKKKFKIDRIPSTCRN